MSLGKDLIDWLLASQIPSIRHAAMTKLLGWPSTHAQVRRERQEIMRAGPVPAILAGQTSRGNWQPERSYYTPKYTSTHWSMLLLAELNVDGEKAAARRGAAYMLEATKQEADQNEETKAHGLSCFWGNLLRYALHCGYAGDPRLKVIADYLAHDGLHYGWQCPHNWEIPCAWGAARSLWGLALLPGDQRSREVEATIERGLDFLLAGETLVRGEFPHGGRIHAIWSRLNFPLFYQADVLFILRIAAELKALAHPGAQPALAWLRERRTRTGRWRGSSPFRQRTWPDLGEAQDVDRWVSIQAANILRSAAG